MQNIKKYMTIYSNKYEEMNNFDKANQNDNNINSII